MADGVAHIRWFKPPGAWFQRIGCFVDGELRFSLKLLSDDILDVAADRVLCPTSPDVVRNGSKYPLVYDIPGGELVVGKWDRNAGMHTCDGHVMREEWTTSSVLKKVYGPHVFDVDPNDDSLRFPWTNTDADLRRVIIGIREFGRLNRCR